jgi:hypothetical protein
VGVIIGAASTGWLSWLFARRSERADFRQSRRRVAIELGRLAQDLGVVLRVGQLNTTEGFFNTSVWTEEQRTLARRLSDEDWEVLAVVFENLDGIRQLLGANVKVSLPTSTRERLQRLLVGVQDGRRILGAEPVPVSIASPAATSDA